VLHINETGVNDRITEHINATISSAKMI